MRRVLHFDITIVLFILFFINVYKTEEVNLTDNDKAAWPDFGSIFVSITSLFTGSNGKCATYEGASGTCKGPRTSCPNLANFEKTSCVYAMANNGICCPHQMMRRPVMPMRNAIACGNRFPPEKAFLNVDSNEINKNMSEYLIVGGESAPVNSWPWAVIIQYKSAKTGNYSHICGGSIINERYVLSAAHCVLSTNPNDFRIKMGSNKRNEGGDIVEVDKVVVHDSYVGSRHQNDISLFRLKKKLQWRDGLAPVCLPTADLIRRDVTGFKTWLVGWGTTSAGGKVSNELLEVQVPIVPNAKCAQVYDNIFSGPDRISERQICAGYDEGKKDSCQGDSGGPLMIEIDNRIYQFGIVSYGLGCAKPRYPGVYTRVAWFMPWIGLQMESDFPRVKQK